MIPPEFHDINKSEAEKHLYYKLNETFNDEWIIFHSYNFESRNKYNKIIDSEIDFYKNANTMTDLTSTTSNSNMLVDAFNISTTDFVP